jgi:hypothetical protein
MERRKFVVGLGALASGSAAAVGTGAFTSVEANRTVNVNVADDTNAYVGLRATSDPNGQFASGSGSDEMIVDFDDSDNGGSGVNPDAETVFEEVFQIENQGTQNVEVDLSSSGSPSITIQDPGDLDVDGISGDGVAAALSTDEDSDGNTDTDGTVELGEGEKVDVDFAVDSGTSDFSGLTLTVEADAV